MDGIHEFNKYLSAAMCQALCQLLVIEMCKITSLSLRQSTNAQCTIIYDLCMNEKCHENMLKVKKDLREEKGQHGCRRIQGEHKSSVRTRNNQCWKDRAGLYGPCKGFCHSPRSTEKAFEGLYERVCMCVCTRVGGNMCVCQCIK